MPALLFLVQRLPYPPTKGEKIRAFHQLQHFARHYDIHLGCLVDDPADMAYVDTLRPLCRDVHVAPVNRRVARWTCLRGLLTGDALSVAYFRHAGLTEWVRDVAARVRPDVTFVYSSNMAPYVLDLPPTGARIIDLVDVDSEKWRALSATAKGPMRLVYRREWRKIAALERRVASVFDTSLLVSAAEAALFARLVPGAAGRIRGVSNGVDHRYFDPAAADVPPFDRPFDPSAPAFVFTGTMDYPPNVDAVGWFATEILPLIRQTAPAARFLIVGANPTQAVLRLGQRDGVTVTGRVPDVRPYLAQATAAVAPMRVARGIQNKVLEAMAMARPVVLTAGALEGIEATPGQEVLLADTSAAFAASCCRMLDPAAAAAIGAAARARVLRDYDWQATLRPLDDVRRTNVAARLTEPA